MTAIDDYIDGIILREGNGKYTNDPKDSGGPTRWGITERTARMFGYRGKIEEIPRDWAVLIYKKMYWEDPGFYLIDDIFPILAERIMDFGVLAGQKTSGVMLQRSLNVLNRNGKDYPDIPTTGHVGEMTISSLKSFLTRRGDDGKRVILGMVASLQSTYLLELAEKRSKDEEYEFGWQLNRSIGSIIQLRN